MIRPKTVDADIHTYMYIATNVLIHVDPGTRGQRSTIDPANTNKVTMKNRSCISISQRDWSI